MKKIVWNGQYFTIFNLQKIAVLSSSAGYLTRTEIVTEISIKNWHYFFPGALDIL